LWSEGAGAVWASANAGSKTAAKTNSLAHASTPRKTFLHRRKRRATPNVPLISGAFQGAFLIFKCFLLALKRLITDVALMQLCDAATDSI
jgi:hypothetical protein